MTPLELDTADVHLGNWITTKSLWALIDDQSKHYHKRLAKYFVGDADDLAQAAALALVEWLNANGKPERIRELVGLQLLHNAMVAEVRANRTLVDEDEVDPLLYSLSDERKHLTDKQIELLEYFRLACARAAKKPHWEICWLSLALKWSDEQIIAYFRRKKDDRQRLTPERIKFCIDLAVRRIKQRIAPDVVDEINALDFQQLVG